MLKRIFQIRYYGRNSEYNYPQLNASGNYSFLESSLIDGTVFKDYLPAIQLSVQSVPGTKFYLNNSQDPIIVGNTGIYEINVDNISEISQIHFDAKSIENINNNPNNFLLVDLVSNDDSFSDGDFFPQDSYIDGNSILF